MTFARKKSIILNEENESARVRGSLSIIRKADRLSERKRIQWVFLEPCTTWQNPVRSMRFTRLSIRSVPLQIHPHRHPEKNAASSVITWKSRSLLTVNQLLPIFFIPIFPISFLCKVKPYGFPRGVLLFLFVSFFIKC